MKYIQDKTGRFSQRPHYEPDEIDQACDELLSEFFYKKNTKIAFPLTTEDLIRLVEQRTDSLDIYADLSSFGDDVEGVTEFQENTFPSVQISGHLYNNPRMENRFRTTLTHELGHVILHGPIVEMERIERQSPMFKRSKASQFEQFVCKRDNILNAAQVDWMEWQAGYACGSFLMPRWHFLEQVKVFRLSKNIQGDITDRSTEALLLGAEMATYFQVSEEAARIRLIKLDAVKPPSNQISLLK